MMLFKYRNFCLIAMVLATKFLVAQGQYGVGSRADNRIDTLLDAFFELRYTEVGKARRVALHAL